MRCVEQHYLLSAWLCLRQPLNNSKALITAQQCSSALWKHPCLAGFAHVTGTKSCIDEFFEDDLICYFEDASEHSDHGESNIYLIR